MVKSFLAFVLLFGLMAYEANLYSFYIVLSLSFVILLTIFNVIVNINAPFVLRTSVFWKVFIIFFVLNYAISLTYNIDVVGIARLFGMIYISFIAILSLRKIDLIFEVLLYFLIVVLGVGYFIQFTVVLVPIWNLVYGRNASIFFDPNFASVFLGLGSFLSLIYLRYTSTKVILSSLFSVGVFFTYSKGGMLALIVGYFYYFFITFNRWTFLYLSMILFFGSIYVFDILGLSTGLDLSMFRFEQGFNERDKLWQFSLDHIVENQNFFGIGAGNLVLHLRENGFTNVSTHSFYFDVLLSYGVLVFIANIVLAVSIALRMIRRKSKYLPLFLVLLINANSILISVGGFGLLSFLLTLLILNEIFDFDEIKA